MVPIGLLGQIRLHWANMLGLCLVALTLQINLLMRLQLGLMLRIFMMAILKGLQQLLLVHMLGLYIIKVILVLELGIMQVEDSLNTVLPSDTVVVMDSQVMRLHLVIKQVVAKNLEL